MGKFIIVPHMRLQEWVAEEHGYFEAEGLDYEFRPGRAQVASVKTAEELPPTSGAGHTRRSRDRGAAARSARPATGP